MLGLKLNYVSKKGPSTKVIVMAIGWDMHMLYICWKENDISDKNNDLLLKCSKASIS